MSKYTDEQITEFAESLEGSCRLILNDEQDIFENMTESQYDIFNDLVFDCANCGWWTNGGDRYYHDSCGDICDECDSEMNEEEEDE